MGSLNLQCLSVLRTSVRFHSSEISILSRTARFFLKWLAAGVLTGGSGIFAYSVFRADARLRNDEYYYWDWKVDFLNDLCLLFEFFDG